MKFTLTAEAPDRTVTVSFEAESYGDILEIVADWLAAAGFARYNLDFSPSGPGRPD